MQTESHWPPEAAQALPERQEERDVQDTTEKRKAAL